MAKYWMSPVPKMCDICNAKIDTCFVDGKTRMGPWANMCPLCFMQYGLGLGIGKGQKYVKQIDGKYMNFEG